MIIGLTDEMCDELFKKTLVDDAKMMVRSIVDIRSDPDWESKSYLKQDMENNFEFLNAMRTLISYYFVYEEAADHLSEIDSILIQAEDD